MNTPGYNKRPNASRFRPINWQYLVPDGPAAPGIVSTRTRDILGLDPEQRHEPFIDREPGTVEIDVFLDLVGATYLDGLLGDDVLGLEKTDGPERVQRQVLIRDETDAAAPDIAEVDVEALRGIVSLLQRGVDPGPALDRKPRKGTAVPIVRLSKVVTPNGVRMVGWSTLGLFGIHRLAFQISRKMNSARDSGADRAMLKNGLKNPHMDDKFVATSYA